MGEPYIVECRLLGSSERIQIPLMKEPEKIAIAHLLATKLFDRVMLIDASSNAVLFEISGLRISEYGDLVLEVAQKR